MQSSHHNVHLNDQVKRRYEELEILESKGINPFPYFFDKTHSANDILNNFSDENPESLGTVSVAGRIIMINRMGKATFIKIHDEKGKIQAYFNNKQNPEEYDNLKLYDLGDIIGITGSVFRTKTGEITIKSEKFELLCKSLQPLPVVKEEIDENGNKIIHDAFKDIEARYRHRYIDLSVNTEVRDVFFKRSKIISGMRRYFDSKGWIEVETPILQPLYGGASARPFVTHHNTLDINLYMRIALELYLKRLLVGGFEGVYEISKNFRNEGMDKTHNPEFTMMEIYVAYKDYIWCMDMTEDLIKNLAFEANNSYKIIIDDKEIDLNTKFERKEWFGLIENYTGLNLFGKSFDELVIIAKNLGIHIEAGWSAMKILDEIFSDKVEPNLINPTFVIDYPLEMSPLAKKHRSKEGLVERFELYINGKEIANSFSELNDPRDQRARFEEQAKSRELGDDEAMVLDEDFLNSLEIGMPPAAGLGIGIDRLVMFITGQTSIRDVIFFPQMKPEKHDIK